MIKQYTMDANTAFDPSVYNLTDNEIIVKSRIIVGVDTTGFDKHEIIFTGLDDPMSFHDALTRSGYTEDKPYYFVRIYLLS